MVSSNILFSVLTILSFIHTLSYRRKITYHPLLIGFFYQLISVKYVGHNYLVFICSLTASIALSSCTIELSPFNAGLTLSTYCVWYPHTVPFLAIKIVFNSFKIQNYLLYKDPVPDDLKSFLAYKFTSASCNSSYIGEICCHFKTRIEEHIKKDNDSHIIKHLHSNAKCFDSYNSLYFKIIGKASCKLDLKIKEDLHINWRKPTLNVQQNHLALTLSL